MTPLEDFLTRITKMNFQKVLVELLDTTDMKELMIELNQSQLFDKGEDSNEQSLGNYSDFTVVLKQAKGQRTDHITLFDEGDFYESMSVTVTPKQTIFDADAQKETTNLFQEYGIDILGLNEDSKQVVRDKLKKELIFFIREKA